MACACNKRRQPTAYGSITPTARTAESAPERPADEPTTLRLPDGTLRTYGSKLEAHADRLRLGGTIEP